MENKRRKTEQFQDWIVGMYPEAIQEVTDIKSRILSRTFTFQVTDACNLACTYCYQINKKTRRMSFETAKLAIDKLLSGADGFGEYINPTVSPAIILVYRFFNSLSCLLYSFNNSSLKFEITLSISIPILIILSISKTNFFYHIAWIIIQC